MHMCIEYDINKYMSLAKCFIDKNMAAEIYKIIVNYCRV